MKKVAIRQRYEREISALNAAWDLECEAHEENLRHASGREELLRSELGKANRAWSRAKAETETSKAQVARLEGQLEAQQQSWNAQRGELADERAELAKLRRQLQAIRTALEPLTKAVFPPGLPRLAQGLTGAYPGSNYILAKGEPSMMEQARAQYAESYSGLR